MRLLTLCGHIRYQECRILELGAATVFTFFYNYVYKLRCCNDYKGALSMFMAAFPRNLNIVTSDVVDGGEVETNIIYNFELNGKHYTCIYYYSNCYNA